MTEHSIRRLSATLCAATLALFAAGCASTGTGHASFPSVPTVPRTHSAQMTGLESFISTVRTATASSRPAPSTRALQLELTDRSLREALAEIRAHDSGAARHRAGAAYLRHGIKDLAFDQYRAAARLNPRDAAAHDALARIWRDWGWLSFALTEAHRAVFHAPRSAVARNTLGTILAALGEVDAARQVFERARVLDPGATWATMNLCRVSPSVGESVGVPACERLAQRQTGAQEREHLIAPAATTSSTFLVELPGARPSPR